MVYLDVLFLLNGAVDYVLCLLTARLSGIPLRRRRYLLAALLGGLYGAAVFLPGAAWLAKPPMYCAAGGVMLLIAYGGERRFPRLALLFCLLSCGLAGVLLGLAGALGGGRHFSGGLLGAAAALLALTLGGAFRSSLRSGLEGRLISVRIGAGGRRAEVTALLDTGNQLRDPVSGRPVLVVSPETVRRLLPPEARDRLPAARLPAEWAKALGALAPELKPGLLPYRGVGTTSGMLLSFRTDWLEIRGVRQAGGTAAMAPDGLGEVYDALWCGDLEGLEGGTHEGFHGAFASFAGAARAGSGGLLHRRQRYPAAAADTGAGGVPAGADPAAGGPAGAD